MDRELLEQFDGGILVLTLNRPDRLNALNQRLMLQLTEVTRRASEDPDVRVVVIRGAGRAFCSGGDLKEGAQPDHTDVVNTKQSREEGWPTAQMQIDRIMRHSEAIHRLHTMPKPTIALVHGHAMGAGMALALSCDIRICATNAQFGTSYASVGYSGDFGISYLLPLWVGHGKARELLLSSATVHAEEAVLLGLASRAVAVEELESEGLAMARNFAQGPTVAYRYIKNNLTAAETMSFVEVLQLETANQIAAAQTADHREARRAFSEKRKPNFLGT